VCNQENADALWFVCVGHMFLPMAAHAQSNEDANDEQSKCGNLERVLSTPSGNPDEVFQPAQ
jgi:hypothetical protein